MSDDETYVICGHCNQNVIALVRATYRQEDKEFGMWFEWRILQCGACKRPLLDALDSDDIISPNDGPVILYPDSKLNMDNLPKAVGKAYAEVLRVRRISPPACAVMIARTLETVCNQENIQGNNLKAKLEKLALAGRLPPVLVEMTQHIRNIRNVGAHADEEDDVTASDIPVMIDFLDAILEYLYIAPRKLTLVQQRLESKKRWREIERAVLEAEETT